jgi:hypothetical protein
MDFMAMLDKNWKLVAGIFVVFVVGGVAFGLLTAQSSKKEHQAQASYFKAEKKYLEIKGKAATPAADAVNKPADYKSVKADFEAVISTYPGSKAAQMSAVYLSDILITENNKDQALVTLQKAENSDSGLINTLVQQQIGSLLADQNKCAEALTVWQKIVDRKQVQFLHNATRLQQALCYQKMNDSKKAEEILTNLANQKSDLNNTDSTAKEAEKYLRLIQYKKASGT